MIWSTKVRTTPRIITISAPARRELTSVPTEVAETSISPAIKACETIGLALMLMIWFHALLLQ
jgi:hypothetical protein